MDLISSAPSTQYTTRLNEAQLNKWQKTGLLDGLQDAKRNNVARLLENQAIEFKQKLQSINEASDVADIKGFQSIAFPMVRRVFAGLLANDIVGVQPMSLPNGLVYYMDFKYGSVKAGNKNDDFSAGASVYGDYNGPDTQSGLSHTGTGGFYDYNTSYSQREIVVNPSCAFTTGSVSIADIDYDPELSGDVLSMIKLTVTGLWTKAVASTSPFNTFTADLTALKHWVPVADTSTVTASGVKGTPVRPDAAWQIIRRLTKVASNGADVEFYFMEVDTPTYSGDVYLSYVAKSKLTADSSGTVLGNTWESDFSDPSAVVLPEIDIRTVAIPITADTRKLKVKWSPELAQDMSAYLNQDPEIELTNILSQTIATEIDREIIGDLLNQASAANYYWSRLPGKFVNKATGAIVSGYSGYVAQTQAQWYQTLIETINDVSNTILKKVIRGAGNFLVVSPSVATMLESVMGWHVEQGSPTTYNIGTQKMGTLANRYTVYKDPYMRENKILVGFKGDSAMETGYVYAPYVPLVVTPTIWNPETFTPSRGAMTRYAKQMIRSDFYGTVTVMDMNIF